mgnify:CR=1 FL=1
MLGGAIAVGALSAVQSRMNGELSHHLGNSLEAAVWSLGSGTVVLIGVLLARTSIRHGLHQIAEALRDGSLRRWQLLGGLFGGFFVGVQSAVVPLLGVAAFTVATVAGQSSNSLVVDRVGVRRQGGPLVLPALGHEPLPGDLVAGKDGGGGARLGAHVGDGGPVGHGEGGHAGTGVLQHLAHPALDAHAPQHLSGARSFRWVGYWQARQCLCLGLVDDERIDTVQGIAAHGIGWRWIQDHTHAQRSAKRNCVANHIQRDLKLEHEISCVGDQVAHSVDIANADGAIGPRRHDDGVLSCLVHLDHGDAAGLCFILPHMRGVHALCREVIPALAQGYRMSGPPTLMGASLGGLAALHAQAVRLGRVVGDLAELSAAETAALLWSAKLLNDIAPPSRPSPASAPPSSASATPRCAFRATGCAACWARCR